MTQAFKSLLRTNPVLSVIFDSLQKSIDPRHTWCPNTNPFDPGRFPYFPDAAAAAVALRMPKGKPMREV